MARGVVASLLLLTALVAGCLGGDDPAANEDLAPQAEPDPRPVERFGGLAANASANRTAVVEDLLDESEQDLPTIRPVLLSVGHEGPEPSVGVRSDGSVYFQALSSTLVSHDNGATWEESYQYDLLGAGTWDPMLWVDPITDRAYASHLNPFGTCTSIMWTDDGEAWERRDGACGLPIVDFQKLSSGAAGPDPNPLVDVGGNPSVLYLCYNKPLTLPLFFVAGIVPLWYGATVCSMSYDGGLTWPLETEVRGCAIAVVAVVPVFQGCGGAAGVPAVSPTGEVVVAIPQWSQGLVLGVSRDSGLTWTNVAGPSGTTVAGAAPEVAFADDGTMFVMWIDGERVAQLARSSDLGASWDGPWRVTAPGVDTNVFNALVVGDGGRVAMATLGSRDEMDSPDEAPEDARWHLFIVTSEDADGPDPSFTSYQATPMDDPVQIGRICLSGISCDGSRNLLDFIDATAGPDGTLFVAFADGCTEDCAGRADAGSDDSRSSEGMLARLDGWSLTSS